MTKVWVMLNCWVRAFEIDPKPGTVAPPAWKRRLLELEEGDVLLHRFSPTGFYSSAVNNAFLQELQERSGRQIPFAVEPDAERGLTEPLPFGTRGRFVYIHPSDKARVSRWHDQGHTEAMKTPDSTLIYVTPPKAEEIRADQIACMGCLSACQFSNWAQNETSTTGRKADPRSYCIQKTLQAISHSDDVDHQLMFAGHNAYRFRNDQFYANGDPDNIPVRHILDRGERTRPLDLRGRARSIRNIEMVYRALPNRRDREPIVCVEGLARDY